MRKMIYWLDQRGDTTLADTVMECAEPPAGVCVVMRNSLVESFTFCGLLDGANQSHICTVYTYVHVYWHMHIVSLVPSLSW